MIRKGYHQFTLWMDVPADVQDLLWPLLFVFSDSGLQSLPLCVYCFILNVTSYFISVPPLLFRHAMMTWPLHVTLLLCE